MYLIIRWLRELAARPDDDECGALVAAGLEMNRRGCTALETKGETCESVVEKNIKGSIKYRPRL